MFVNTFETEIEREMTEFWAGVETVIDGKMSVFLRWQKVSEFG